jgi:tetratricopeptide (TPR) repeat protein
MNRWIPALGLAAAALLAAPASAQEKTDPKSARSDVLVVTEAGKQVPKNGTVESADYEKVVFTAQGGKKADVPAADVVEIVWGDAPPAYSDGVRALAAGDADGARRGFEAAIAAKEGKTPPRDWVNEYGSEGLGAAYLRLGDADKAAESFARARTANAKSMILDRILMGLAEAELVRGKGDAAAKAADDLVAAAKSARRPAWELSAYLVKAKGKLSAGDFAGAASAFDDAVRFADGALAGEKTEAGKARLRRASLEASVRKGWALVAKAEGSKSQGDFDAARSWFDGLASKNAGEALVLASQSNASAIAKFSAGDAKGALRQFMTTEVVHFGAPDEVARAIWWQAECWKKLGNEARRQERLKDLKQSFPGSEWARKAP